jgi:hypothetical protein
MLDKDIHLKELDFRPYSSEERKTGIISTLAAQRSTGAVLAV